METKGKLTRDEAREAIEILALINGNLESIMVSIFAILILFISSDLFVYYLSAKSSLSFASLVKIIIVIIFIILIIAIVAFCESREIYRRANKLAKKHKLGNFLDVIFIKMKGLGWAYKDKEQENKKLHDYK